MYRTREEVLQGGSHLRYTCPRYWVAICNACKGAWGSILASNDNVPVAAI